jgi:hypothetical protein
VHLASVIDVLGLRSTGRTGGVENSFLDCCRCWTKTFERIPASEDHAKQAPTRQHSFMPYAIGSRAAGSTRLAGLEARRNAMTQGHAHPALSIKPGSTDVGFLDGLGTLWWDRLERAARVLKA